MHNLQRYSVAFEIPENLAGQALFPAVCLKNAECHVNFGGGGGGLAAGASSFKFAPPPGYAGVAAAVGLGTFHVTLQSKHRLMTAVMMIDDSPCNQSDTPRE
jgi:hypothetical protein